MKPGSGMPRRAKAMKPPTKPDSGQSPLRSVVSQWGPIPPEQLPKPSALTEAVRIWESGGRRRRKSRQQ